MGQAAAAEVADSTAVDKMGSTPKVKRAVVLLNLGGPTSMDEVRPFLFSLFNDPATIDLPNPFRYLLATLLSSSRYKEASKIYETLGGKSPLLEETQKQADALSNLFEGNSTRVFVAMRHATPRTEECFAKVRAWGPEEVILLPLYPQFSVTTTGSGVEAWRELEDEHRWYPKTSAVCCYPTMEGFIDPLVADIKAHYEKAKEFGNPQVILSAHGLPEVVVAKGDPYQAQVEATGNAIIEKLDMPGLDASIAYQSRVGPLPWIQPYTEEVLVEASRAKRPIIMVPIAFVSEHSETLVELDIEYGELAAEAGTPAYFRVPTVSVASYYIQGLYNLVMGADRGFTCPKTHKQCPQLSGNPYFSS
eukprot:CAMPEP_0179258918 /NCGR_PEP_ID=MMETSP0797-20121207/25559_1 /TAXON_ID=47934 /ORGANISM="Dinophysis acuminata, Strain DAEP01" /LENGTH=361 /DNA_ID=CAMNT_0020966957 /DNA_START=51 /DNA_END=1136 /DNA_ORIENTATION=-